MEKSISIYLFVIYLTVLSEEANNQVAGSKNSPPFMACSTLFINAS